MYQGIECKIYPNEKQRQLIHMTFGHTRFIWNEMLAMLNPIRGMKTILTFRCCLIMRYPLLFRK